MCNKTVLCICVLGGWLLSGVTGFGEGAKPLTEISLINFSGSSDTPTPGASSLSGQEVLVGKYEGGSWTITGSTPVKKIGRSNSGQVQQNTLAIAKQAAEIDRLDHEVSKLDTRVSDATALSSALDFQRPKEGKPMRVSLGSALYDDRSAVGVGLTAVYRDLDMAVGFSSTGDESLGKASIGFSFP
jgi:hypothetical protein